MQVRFEWGPTGAAAVVAPVTVVVDVLSFTTTLSVAVERGMTVYPFRWKDERAEAYAEQRGAVLARGRSLRDGVSLSPVSVRAARIPEVATSRPAWLALNARARATVYPVDRSWLNPTVSWSALISTPAMITNSETWSEPRSVDGNQRARECRSGPITHRPWGSRPSPTPRPGRGGCSAP